MLAPVLVSTGREAGQFESKAMRSTYIPDNKVGQDYFLPGFVCDNAEAAIDLVRLLDLPSRRAADALRATAFEVCFGFFAIPFTPFLAPGCSRRCWLQHAHAVLCRVTPGGVG